MQPSTTNKEIQALIVRLAALNRFISRYSVRLRPFFRALKGVDVKGWEPECTEALQAIKEHIASPLSLSHPVNKEELYLYLSTSETTMSVALVRLDSDKRKRPI